MTDWYYLKHRKPMPYGCNVLTDPKRFAKLNNKHYTNHERRIRVTYLNGVKISTVFLGLDHSYCFIEPQNTPVLFETMIFGGEHDGYQTRCCTHRGALRMHWKAVNEVKNNNKD